MNDAQYFGLAVLGFDNILSVTSRMASLRPTPLLILHRKNALFYKVQKGARVGDIFMSIIHSAELNGENPFEYLEEDKRWEERQGVVRQGQTPHP